MLWAIREGPAISGSPQFQRRCTPNQSKSNIETGSVFRGAGGGQVIPSSPNFIAEDYYLIANTVLRSIRLCL